MTAQCSIRAIAFIQSILCQLCVASCAAETQFKSIQIKCTKETVPFHSENWNVKSATHCLFHASFTRVQVRQTRKNRNFMNSLSSSDISTEQNCPFELNSLTIGRKGSKCCDQICVSHFQFVVQFKSFIFVIVSNWAIQSDRREVAREREKMYFVGGEAMHVQVVTHDRRHTHTLC